MVKHYEYNIPLYNGNRVVGTVSHGQPLRVIGELNNGWLPVETENGLQGYIDPSKIQRNNSISQNQYPTTILSENLNVYLGDTTVGIARKGETVYILGQPRGIWTPIQTQSGIRGYVNFNTRPRLFGN
jgi:uncharacterized protein YgiM (DUF1202 family)